MRIVRVLALAGLTALAGCGSSRDFSLVSWGQDTPPPPPASPALVSSPASATVDTTGSIGSAAEMEAPPLVLNDAPLAAGDDVALGKRHYSERDYRLAERHFRRATEKTPRNGDAWLGLAASYDRLKRYHDADRAYARAVAILGPKTDVINSIGYSYLLRGDLRRARAKFAEAQAKDPGNPTVANNIALVDEARRRKGVN